MNKFKTTSHYDDWFDDLEDERAVDRVRARIYLARKGNFGDCRWNVKKGVSEMRIHYGPGYRLYFCQRGDRRYLLLTGGTKSQQPRDIERAVEIKEEPEGGADGYH
jgi:putative addiction module killer protein